VAFGTMAGSGAVVLASGGQDGTVRLWDPVAGTATGPPLAGHGGWVAAVAFPAGRGGRTLLASGGDTTIQVWDAAAGARVQTLRRRAAVSCLAACGPLLAIGEYEGVSVVELAGAAAGA
jgi:WD40 repeat protein